MILFYVYRNGIPILIRLLLISLLFFVSFSSKFIKTYTTQNNFVIPVVICINLPDQNTFFFSCFISIYFLVKWAKKFSSVIFLWMLKNQKKFLFGNFTNHLRIAIKLFLINACGKSIILLWYIKLVVEFWRYYFNFKIASNFRIFFDNFSNMKFFW